MWYLLLCMYDVRCTNSVVGVCLLFCDDDSIALQRAKEIRKQRGVWFLMDDFILSTTATKPELSDLFDVIHSD